MAEISEKELEEIEDLLNHAIGNLLFEPSGDPGWHNCAGAARCFEVLKILKLDIGAEDEVRKLLETDNICEQNFLK